MKNSLTYKKLEKAIKKAITNGIEGDLYLPIHPNSIVGKELKRLWKIKRKIK